MVESSNISKFRIAAAFVAASLFFSVSYYIIGALVYRPYWDGMAPVMELSESWAVLVLIIPISFVIFLLSQLLFVLPIILGAKAPYIKNLVFFTFYVTFVFFMTLFFFGQVSFQPPQLQILKNGLSGPRELMSDVQPEKYAGIYHAWQQELIKKCINIVLNGLLAGVVFWRFYTGSFRIFLRRNRNER